MQESIAGAPLLFTSPDKTLVVRIALRLLFFVIRRNTQLVNAMRG